MHQEMFYQVLTYRVIQEDILKGEIISPTGEFCIAFLCFLSQFSLSNGKDLHFSKGAKLSVVCSSGNGSTHSVSLNSSEASVSDQQYVSTRSTYVNGLVIST